MDVKQTRLFAVVTVLTFALSFANQGVAQSAPGAAPAQQTSPELAPLKPPPPAGQKPGTELEPIKMGTLTGLAAVEWYIYGLQVSVKTLQSQVRSLQDQAAVDRKTIQDLQSSTQTLQAALQKLQAQYANHSHVFTQHIVGHPCEAVNTFWLEDGSHQRQLVPLTYGTKCSNPNWNGFSPDATGTVHVSTPMAGGTSAGDTIDTK